MTTTECQWSGGTTNITILTKNGTSWAISTAQSGHQDISSLPHQLVIPRLIPPLSEDRSCWTLQPQRRKLHCCEKSLRSSETKLGGCRPRTGLSGTWNLSWSCFDNFFTCDVEQKWIVWRYENFSGSSVFDKSFVHMPNEWFVLLRKVLQKHPIPMLSSSLDRFYEKIQQVFGFFCEKDLRITVQYSYPAKKFI